jgi:hypothetical protein
MCGFGIVVGMTMLRVVVGREDDSLMDGDMLTFLLMVFGKIVVGENLMATYTRSGKLSLFFVWKLLQDMSMLSVIVFYTI